MDSTAVRHVRLGTAQKFVVLAAAALTFLLLAGIFATPAHASVQSIQIADKYIYRSGSATGTTVSGVSYNSSSKTLTLNGTNIKPEWTDQAGIYIDGFSSDTVNIVLRGSNTITADSHYSDGIRSNTRLVFSGSKLTTEDCDYGIYAYDITVKSGTYNLFGCDEEGMHASQYIRLNGGKCNITTQWNFSYALLAANGRVINKPARLGTIVGQLGKGTSFKAGGSTYDVTEGGYKIKLAQYGSSNKRVKFDSEITIGNTSYQITEIGTKAFKNKKGKKVQSLTISSDVEKLDKQALAGMKKLKSLKIGSCVKTVGAKAFSGTKKLKKMDLSDAYYLTDKGGNINKEAFQKCGKKNGKKLVVRTGWWNKSSENKKIKKFLVSRGMSKKVKVKE